MPPMRGKRMKSAEDRLAHRRALEDFGEEVRRAAYECPWRPGRDLELRFKLEVWADWRTATGRIKRKDLKNILWHVEDYVSAALDYDDSQHFEIVLLKRAKPEGLDDYLVVNVAPV